MSSNTYHHGDLKEAIILSAHKILKEQGADALSLRAIAADVGVSHMAPYAHFKNKKALCQAIAAFGFDELAGKMLSDSQGETKPHALVLAYGATYLAFAIGNPELYRLMLGQVETKGRNRKKTPMEKKNAPVVSSELEASSKRPYSLLYEAFLQINEKGSEVEAKHQALGAWSLVHGMAALIVEGHIPLPEDKTLKEFLALTAMRPPR